MSVSASLRIAFMGTPDFAVPALDALAAAGHDIAAVYSQPPRPTGRGHREHPSPVHAFAQSKGIAVFTPASLKSVEEHDRFRALKLDVAVVAAYGLILPQAILDAPRLGCVNIHASLLPRWRGAAPIHRALLAGDSQTGVTIMRMEAGLDTGPMLMIQALDIAPDDTTARLHDRLAALGAQMIVEAVDRLAQGQLTPQPQPQDGVTYAKKLEKDEGRIDWSRPASEIATQARGLNPWPGLWCEIGGQRLKVLEASTTPGSGAPGVVIAAPLVVACGQGALSLDRVQRAGKAAVTAADYVRGVPTPVGSRFDLPQSPPHVQSPAQSTP